MSKQSKDNIENFFRKGAQKYDFEFNESDWHKLEVRLDRELPVAFSPWIYLKRYWPLPLILIFGLGSILNYQKLSGSYNETNLYETQNDPNIENVELKTSYKIQTTENEENIPSSIMSDENLSNNKSLESKITGQNTSHIINSTDNDQYYYRQNVVDKNLSKDIYQYPDGISKNNVDYDIRNRSEGNITSNSLTPILTKKLFPVFTIPPYTFGTANEINTIQESETVIPEKKKSNNFLSFGVGLSPDFSTVNASDFVSPGVRWKFYLEYNFSERFAISSGAIYVNNKYEAYGEDYHAPARYWKNGIVASEAYGECIMIDIPLNIRYNPLIKGKHQLFISGGISTYFILKEDYFFSYDVDDPDLPDYWGTDKLSSYPFGIVNASIGYEYLLNRKSSLQVEPFINIPTTGIGWGEVKLYTVGIFFAYKFRPGKIKY